jgi:hypothetical protein
VEASTAQMANRSSHRRITVSGPATAITVVITPNTSTHSSRPRNPSTRSDTTVAALAITNSSKVAQPRFWTTLQMVGSSEPRSPSGAR